MPRPGWDVISRDQPVPPEVPTDTGVWFAVGDTAIGPVEPTLVRSLTSYENIFGDRTGGPALYDAVDTYFREGGSKAYICAFPATPSVLELAYEVNQTGVPKKSNNNAKKAGNGEAVVTPAAALPADIIACIDKFTDALGPGQISAPGNVDATVNDALLQHTIDHNRVALIEAPQGLTAAALITYAAAMRTHAGARNAALFAPLGIIPGIASGTTRAVGWSSVAAGIIARNDSRGLSANEPSAGVNGLASYAIDIETRFTDAEYTQLNDASVDMAQYRWGRLATYGYRTLVDPAQVPQWWSFGNARLEMAIVAEAGAIAERYVFSQLDGRGKRIAQFGGDLRGMLIPFFESGALFGESAEDAFQVNVGPSVNTPETIAAGELHAIIMVRMSPFAEYVVIEIVKVATTQSIAA
jgi:phage tail sheath protein FI